MIAKLRNPSYFIFDRIPGMLIILVVVFSYCQKGYLGPVNSYGTNFNLLQKMVINSDSGIATHTFQYTASGQLTTHNILFNGKNPSRVTNIVEQYYRNGTGTADSIKLTYSLNGVNKANKKLFFSYTSGSKIGYSVIWENSNDPSANRDSSVYLYNGNFLIERTDYQAIGSGDYSSTAYSDLIFQYSEVNISNAIFKNTVSGSTITTLASFNYDTSKAALPVNGFQYGYASVGFAYQEYAATHNLVKSQFGDASAEGAVYVYKYLPVGKPYYATLTTTNSTGAKSVATISFYYD